MKNTILLIIAYVSTLTVHAQGRFVVKDIDTFKLHAYTSADPLEDMSYIIESKNGLVILEPLAFFDDIEVFGKYIDSLNKPVEKIIADYHIAGFSAFDHSKYVIPEGMSQFVKGDIYSGMMVNFANSFQGKIDVSDFIPITIIAKNTTQKWIGIPFTFFPGASTDFPAASILIGTQVYYTHFAPVADKHMSPLQIVNRDAIDATLLELDHAKSSGATVFIGGHGVAIAEIEAINFQIDYLKKMRETVDQIKTADEFVLIMQMLYPNIEGEDNLALLADNLYKE